MTPLLYKIPYYANWCYVSDAATITINPPDEWFYPGVFNQSGIVQAGQTVLIYINSCSYQLTALSTATEHGINVDIVVGLYDISQSPAAWVGQATFAPPYGTAANGLVMNHNMKWEQSTNVSSRHFGSETPLIMQITAPSTGGPFQVGAGMHFFLDANILIQYSYHIHSAYVVQGT